MRALESPILKAWLPLAFGITVLVGLTYTSVQQSLRLGANDPQVAIATDLSAALASNENVADRLPLHSIDIGLSLSPFVILFNEDGQVVYSNVVSNGPTPVPPVGVFEYTRHHLDDRITWQPEDNERFAIVVQHYKSSTGSGFVLVGRNLREVESRETQAMQLAILAWLFALGGSFGIMLLLKKVS